MIRRNNKTASPLTRCREELPLIGVSLVLALGIASLQALSSAQEEDPLLSITILPESGEERVVPAGGRIHLTALGNYVTQDIPVRSRWDLLDRSTAEGRLVRCDSTTRCAVEAAEGSEGELVVRAVAEGQTADAVLTVIPVQENPFTDELPAWAAEAIVALHEMGIIQGYEDGSFGPANPVTRGQMITLVYRLLENQELIVNVADEQRYGDVGSGHYAFEAADTFYRQGWAVPNPDFDPEGQAPRGVTAAFLGRVFGGNLDIPSEEELRAAGQVFPDVPDDHLFFLEVASVNAGGLMTGYGNGEFGVDDPLDRASVAVILHRILNLGMDALVSYDPDATEEEPVECFGWDPFMSCFTANGRGGCQDGFCIIEECYDGWSDANGRYSDGCEEEFGRPGEIECGGHWVNTEIDDNNCGACGIVCDEGNMCSQGTCVERIVMECIVAESWDVPITQRDPQLVGDGYAKRQFTETVTCTNAIMVDLMDEYCAHGDNAASDAEWYSRQYGQLGGSATTRVGGFLTIYHPCP